jgi:hypothetical protein
MKQHRRKCFSLATLALAIPLNLLIFSGCAPPPESRSPVLVHSEARARSIVGNATYTYGNVTYPLDTYPLEFRTRLQAGATITSSSNGPIRLSINVHSALLVAPETTLTLRQMDLDRFDKKYDSKTIIDLKIGCITGQALHTINYKDNGFFSVNTPNGTAEIHGKTTDFRISAVDHGKEGFQTTFTCIKGRMDVDAIQVAAKGVKTLHAGESWTPGLDEPHKEPLELRDLYELKINQLLMRA